MSLNDEREWRQRTAAGQLAEAMGVPVGARCPFSVVEAHVLEARERASAYGRELTTREVELVRQAVELRYRPEPALRLPADVPDIVKMVNSRVLGAGWRYDPEFGPGEGMAMRQPDGSYNGDPEITAKAQAADAAARAKFAGISNIATSYHVGPPT